MTSPAPARRARRPEVRVPAAADPVARVVVDVPLAHLDRVFDYLVPEGLDAAVVPGGRVRVRFAGQLVDAYVLERVAASAHPGRLAFVERATSAEPRRVPRSTTRTMIVAWAAATVSTSPNCR